MNFNNSDFSKGAQEIAEKLRSLTFQTISHTISTMDIQPTYDNCILIVVTGALKVNKKKTQHLNILNNNIMFLFRRIMIHQCNLLKHFFYVLLIIHGL
jgi:hypothetical protein